MPAAKNINSNSTLSPRLKELQQKIHDDSYVNNAIDRIAVVMSRHLVEGQSLTGNTADFMMH